MPAFTRYSDPALNTFKKTNMFYVQDPFLKYQDPTYMGFKLFFLFNQPGSGLLCDDPAVKNTAISYLAARGESARVEYLKSFVSLLKRINQETPWFFQAIEGLDEAWKHMFQEKDYKPILTDKKITINCLDESVDLRMTALMDLYRKACFDFPNRREIVPINLRRFKVAVYCYEARWFNKWGWPFSPSTLGAAAESLIPSVLKQGKEEMDKWFGEDPVDNSLLGNLAEAAKNPDATLKSVGAAAQERKQDALNENISRVMFQFEYCEFLPDESNTTVAGISNKEMGLKAQKIVFSYRNVSEDNQYRFFSNIKVTDNISMAQVIDGLSLDTPELLKNVPSQAMPFVNGAIARGMNELSNVLKTALNSLFLGNVYGFNPAGAVSAIANGGVSGAISTLSEIGKNASKKNNTKDEVKGFADNPFTSLEATSGGVSNNASLVNDRNSNPSTNQGTSPENASLSNKTKEFDPVKYFDDFLPSLSNDKSPKAGSQSPSPENPSLSNNTTDSTEKIDNVYGNSASLGNDDGPDSTTQGASPENTSLSNLSGSNPSTDQGSPNGNVSLNNDNGPDSTDQGSPNGNVSLNNDNGPDSKSQGSPNGNVSLNNG
jgi:hypothetical protein